MTAATDSIARVAAMALLVGALSACGSDGRGDGSGAESDLPAPAAQGRQIANSSGCAACHGADGQGGVGPAWTGLYGAQVELDDGTVVVADDAYLRQSIIDPGAARRRGATMLMPESDLDSADVDAVIAYIRWLSTGTDGPGDSAP